MGIPEFPGETKGTDAVNHQAQATPGGGLNVETDYQSDGLGRPTQVLGPVHTAVVDGQAVTVRTATWTYYDDADHETLTAQGYETVDSNGDFVGWTVVNPVTVEITDGDGEQPDAIQATLGAAGWLASSTASTEVALPSGELPLSLLAGIGSPLQTSYVSWTHNNYVNQQLVSTEAYYDISQSLYNQTDYSYLCPCQLAGVDFLRAGVLFSPGTEMRVGGAGGGASSPCSPAGRGRNHYGRHPRWGRWWQDASRGRVGAPGGLSA